MTSDSRTNSPPGKTNDPGRRGERRRETLEEGSTMTKKMIQRDNERPMTEAVLKLVSAGAGGTTKGGDVPVITG